MPPATPDAVREQIASGRTDPLYLVVGEDEAAKRRLANEFARLVEDDLRVFNVERLYGGETSAAAIIDAARTLPMVSPRRVVLVLRAERLLMPRRESEKGSRDLAALEAFIRAPAPRASVVLVASGLDRRRRIVAALRAHATVVECGGLDGATDAHAWVRARMAEADVQIDAEAVGLLVRLAGPDMARLRGDVERVLLFVAGQSRARAADVAAVVGPAVSQDAWAVTRAIERSDAATALRELMLALEAGTMPQMIVGQLGWVVRTKLPPARVPAAVEALYRTDLDLKTSAGDSRVLLARLVVELCGRAAGRRRLPGRRDLGELPGES